MPLGVKLLLFAAILGVGALVLRPQDPRARLTAMPVPSLAPPAARITYRAGHYPQLSGPDGLHTVKSLLNVPQKMSYGGYAWNDYGVPSGTVWVRVDLGRQTLSIFRAGHEIGTAVILYGTDGKRTPTGVFQVLERAAEHRSTLYDADMPYMLRLTSDGVAIHASNVRAGSATHGCIGVPPEFAKLLFEQIRKGDTVAILSDDSVTPTARRIA